MAIARELRGIGQARLQAAAAALSARYRAEHGQHAQGASHVVHDASGAAAYAAYRLPATYAAVAASMAAIAARLPGWAPRSLLDAGAGLGAAVWAATNTWEGLAEAELIEAEPAMIHLGQRLAAGAHHAAIHRAVWQRADLLGPWRAAQHDLAVAAYLLGELPEGKRTTLVARLWEQGSMLLLVEPGTPRGWAIIRAAREQLRGMGAQIVAPCPHQGVCPLPADDWCHFVQRVARSQAQRAAKDASLGYEDEKFSYVAVAREPGSLIAARVLRHPLIRPGQIALRLCTADGIGDERITRANRASWRTARAAAWGDALLPEPESE